MTEKFDLLIRGATCVTPAGTVESDIGFRQGKIAALGALGRASAETTIEAKGLHALPGVIDSQVHFREPGAEHKEDLESGTRGAILGGVTTIFEMPNTDPPTTDAARLEDKLSRAAGRAWCDHAFFIGATAENAGRLAALEKLDGCCGVKVFMGSSTGTLLVADDDGLRRVLENGTRRVAIHAEDEMRLRERFAIAENGGTPRLHPEWRDEEVALTATRRIVALAREARRPVHVLHISTAAEMAFLAHHKEIATVEVTPQHLTLCAPDCYDELGTLAQMNPPIRDAAQRDGLWRAVAEGVVDVIGSDHAPHRREEKDRPYPQSPSGMPGVQTMVPIMLTHVNEGRLSLERFVDLVSAGPARIYGIAAKGRLAVGYDGDVTLVDLRMRRRIENSWIASKCGWTPFADREAKGWPVATILRGRVVMRDGELIGPPAGAPARFIGR